MKTTITFTALLVWALIHPTSGDTLHLRNGSSIEGGLVGFDGKTVTFATTTGVQSFSRSEVQSLVFTAPEQASPAPTTKKTAPVSGTFSLPAGTLLIVSMSTPVSSNDSAGRSFTAKLEADLVAGETTVVPAGTIVYGKITKSTQARRLAGRSSLEIALTGIKINGAMLPLATGNFKEASQNSLRKTARNAGAGAAIGHAFGDNDDAKKGAAIGVGVSILRKGKSIQIPAGAMLEFSLTQPLSVTL
jgi:hypothetical protein